MPEEDRAREMGRLAASIENHDHWIKAVQDELRSVGKVSQDEIRQLRLELQASRAEAQAAWARIDLAMAERKGVERAAMWMVGLVASILSSGLVLGIQQALKWMGGR